MRLRRKLLALSILLAVVLAALWALTFGPEARRSDGGRPADTAAPGRPALTVAPVRPERADWPRTLDANGNIAAWQEAVIGAEISNLRLTEVLVNVGDRVAKGQELARIAAETVAAELAQSRAALAEAQANLEEAKANAERARRLQPQGMISAQQYNQFVTAEQTAAARVASAQARLRNDAVRLEKTRVLAPDDGVISARAATVGSLTQPGQELFRLIRGGRLEWRAEVTAVELGRIRPGGTATLIAPDGGKVEGMVRRVAPTVDPQTRMALVYVDLPADAGGLRAGMFARGAFDLGRAPALTLPQSAVVLREGFAYVFRIEGERVAQTKVAVGRRAGDRVEITSGLEEGTSVVGQGAGFLSDGDTVRVVAGGAAKAE